MEFELTSLEQQQIRLFEDALVELFDQLHRKL